MNLIQSGLGIILLVGLLFVAGYLVIPVILALLVIGAINFLNGKPVITTRRFTDTLKRARPRRQSQPPDEKIIDVDYTELP